MRAVEKNKAAEDLRRTLTARLTKASARLDEVTKRLIQVHMQIKELELRFREAVKLVRIPARAQSGRPQVAPTADCRCSRRIC